MKKILYILLGALAISCASLYSIEGYCTRVLDGDTIEVIHNGRIERVRFSRIDAYENHTRKGKKATRWLKRKIEGQRVIVERHGVGRYGRTLGEVYFRGVNLNNELLDLGHAVIYKYN